MIHAIRLSGFKSFVEWTEVPMRPLTMLAGSNGAGKSTILQAFLLMKQTVEHPPGDASLRLDGPLVPLGTDRVCSAHETVIEAEFAETALHRFRLVCAPDDRRRSGRLQIRELQHDGDRAVAAAADQALEAFAARAGVRGSLFAMRDRWIAMRGATPEHEIRHRDVGDAVSARLIGVLRRRLADGAFPGTNARERNHRSRAVEHLDGGDLEAGASSLLRIRSARPAGAPPALPRPILNGVDLVAQQVLGDVAHLVDLDEFVRVADPAPQQAFELVERDDRLSAGFFGFRARLSTRSVLHLGPVRADPRDLHDDVPVDSAADIDPKGALATAYLHQHRDDLVGVDPWRPDPARDCRLPPGCGSPGSPRGGGRPATLREAVDLWLRFFGIAHELVVDSHPPFGLTLGSRSRGDAGLVSAPNGGAGLSSVLPVLVLGLAAETYGTVIYEHPEAHLHPEVQLRLFDFFQALVDDHVQVVVETHSRHLLDRARHDIARRRLSAFNVGVVFVERNGGGSRVRNADIAEWARGGEREQAAKTTTLRDANLRGGEPRLRQASGCLSAPSPTLHADPRRPIGRSRRRTSILDGPSSRVDARRREASIATASRHASHPDLAGNTSDCGDWPAVKGCLILLLPATALPSRLPSERPGGRESAPPKGHGLHATHVLHLRGDCTYVKYQLVDG